MKDTSESYECTIMISVEATSINMIGVSQLAVEEGSITEYICMTDSAYPEPPTVLWLMNDVSVSVNDAKTEQNTLPGDFYGNKTKSTLRLKLKRGMNQKKLKCVLENDDTKWNEYNLNVTCKFMLCTHTSREWYNLKSICHHRIYRF